MTISYFKQKGLIAFQVWSDWWLSKLNINKCKIAFYGRDVNHEYKDYLFYTDLERVNVINDICVVFDCFVSCYKEKISRAYSMLGPD